MFFLLKDTLRPLRKELKMAGVDISKVKQWQKIYEKVKKHSPQIEQHYIGVKTALEELESVLEKLENDLIYGKGISRQAEVLDLAVNYDIINKSGAWFSYNDEKLGQGRENVKEFMKQNPNFTKEIEEKIRETLRK